MNRVIRRLAIGLLLCYVVLFVQLNVLQVGKRDALREDVRNNRESVRTFDAPRGPIVTADGVVVAQTVEIPVESRGDYRWQMAVPADGKLPFDGAFPALIEWQGTLHPAQALPDSGARLARLEIAHPKAEALKAALSPLFHDPRVVILQGPAKAMRATFTTPHGIRVLE